MQLSTLDQFIVGFDSLLRGATGHLTGTGRACPAQNISDSTLSTDEKQLSASLMRVNYTGEVAAQALYLGQALVARSDETRLALLQAAHEEQDHLLWCHQRLDALDSRTSYLNPFWFVGSLVIGVVAGLCDDKYSLGFVAETENQVEAHLNDHINRLPNTDEKSRAILIQMREDEKTHASHAIAKGGVELPEFVKTAMRLPAKIMTTFAYYI